MKPCKVYSIQENDVIVPETDYYEVVHFDMKEPHVIRSSDGNKPLLVEKEVHCTPIRKFSEISEFGTRINTYVAFDKKLEDYVNTIINEKLQEQGFSHNKEISVYKKDLGKVSFELEQLREYSYQQRKDFMHKGDKLLFRLSLGIASLFSGAVICLGVVFS